MDTRMIKERLLGQAGNLRLLSNHCRAIGLDRLAGELTTAALVLEQVRDDVSSLVAETAE